MDDLLPETGNERQGLILNSDANPARSKLQVFGSFASSTRDAPRNPNRRLPMSAIAARFSGSPMADRWFRGDFRTVRVKSEHVPGESIFVTALTMLKAAKNRHRARRSRRLSSRSANCRALRHTKPAAMEPSDAQKAEAPERRQRVAIKPRIGYNIAHIRRLDFD
jgi:hypothetical protein